MKKILSTVVAAMVVAAAGSAMAADMALVPVLKCDVTGDNGFRRPGVRMDEITSFNDGNYLAKCSESNNQGKVDAEMKVSVKGKRVLFDSRIRGEMLKAAK